jgi:hypothetical protein
MWKAVKKGMSQKSNPHHLSVITPPPASSRSFVPRITPVVLESTPREERRAKINPQNLKRFHEPLRQGIHCPIVIRQISSHQKLFSSTEAGEEDDDEIVLVEKLEETDNDEAISQVDREKHSYEIANIARCDGDDADCHSDKKGAAAVNDEDDDDAKSSVGPADEQDSEASDPDADLYDGESDADYQSDDGSWVDDEEDQTSPTKKQNICTSLTRTAKEKDLEAEGEKKQNTAAAAAAPENASPSATPSEFIDKNNKESTSEVKQHGTILTFRIRTLAQVKALDHYKHQSFSSADEKQFEAIVQEHIHKHKDKFKNLIAKDLLDPNSSNRLIKPKNLPTDWGEIAACCGRQPDLPHDHPLKDVTTMLQRRVKILGQVPDDQHMFAEFFSNPFSRSFG